jgi:PTH1 family peptidyl-tRNA hydrolase
MKLIVGLGNPGEKYSGNRHNIGFMAVDEIARGYSFGPWKKRFQGYTSEGQIGLEKCILLKPSTYMNESGRAVGEAMRFYKLPLGDVIVIHDEIDLKPGVIRVKKSGGNAGHNGLKSISAHAGNDYVRVRLGIDHPGDRAVVANYVLQDFAKSDRDWLIPLLEGVARGMPKLVEGSEAAFLGEAARGRKPSTPAAKSNEAVPLRNGKAQSSPDEVRAASAETLNAQHASGQHLEGAVSEQTLVPQAIEPVVDGALAAAVAHEAEAPVDERIEDAISEQSLAPQASEAVVDGALAAAAAHEFELFHAQASEPPLFETAPEDRAKEKDALRGPQRLFEPRLKETSAASHEGEDNIFKRWFRKRVRGGTK